MKKRLFTFILLLLKVLLFSQTVPQMEFNNQKITDVLLVLSDIGKCTIIYDETVEGNTSFYFQESQFEEALKIFTSAHNLWYYIEDGVYYISKLKIIENNNLLTIDADDVDITYIVKSISKVINKTILYDQLPRGKISIHTIETPISKVLEMIIRKNLEYDLIEDDKYFYIQKLQTQSPKITRYSKNIIKKNDSLFTIQAEKIPFDDFIKQLFNEAQKEYSLLMKTNTVLENISYKNRNFEQILRLILDSVNADYVIKDNVYYIFETQHNNVIKKLKNTKAIKLNNIQAQNLISLLPSGYEAISTIKIDKTSNTIFITGTDEELQPIINFINMIDKPLENRSYERFDIQYNDVTEIIKLIPSDLINDNILIIPNTNSFITMVTPEKSLQLKNYLLKIDKRNTGIPIRLKYINSNELIKFLPPSITKEELVLTSDDTLFFYTGSEKKLDVVYDALKLIDIPKPQIRYELLIIQYQKGESNNFTRTVGIDPISENTSNTDFRFSGLISNLLNINFDVVSQFGYQFALNLNQEISENKAKVLADTTLHGISGTDVKFQNTNTFRYNEGVLEDSSSVVVRTSTKEITSGLQLTINGWISGDGMITMKVNAEVSKQGTVSGSSSDLPPTSEKIVTSEVRTKSGEPIIIGGLLQTEVTENIKKVPFLGNIPLLGRLFQTKNSVEETTEMAIYIVPHVFIQEAKEVVIARNIEKYYTNYLMDKIL